MGVCMGVWVHECVGAWAHECMGAWVHGRMNAWVWVHGCGWMGGCMGAWVYGRMGMGVWVHGRVAPGVKTQTHDDPLVRLEHMRMGQLQPCGWELGQ